MIFPLRFYVPFWVKGGYLDTSCYIRDIIINSKAYHSVIASVLTEQPMFLADLLDQDISTNMTCLEGFSSSSARSPTFWAMNWDPKVLIAGRSKYGHDGYGKTRAAGGLAAVLSDFVELGSWVWHTYMHHHTSDFAVTWWFRSPRTSSLLRGAVSVACLCRVWMTIKSRFVLT